MLAPGTSAAGKSPRGSLTLVKLPLKLTTTELAAAGVARKARAAPAAHRASLPTGHPCPQVRGIPR